MEYDFSGYATRHNIRCSDGRTIMPGAFEQQDGQTIPLVWLHGKNDPSNVLGHALLEHRDDGVYCYCKFNDTTNGQHAKRAVIHKDIRSLSIHANQLIEKNKDVIHGHLVEVSLVLAGANPGAFIDNVVIQHSDDTESVLEDEAVIYSGDEIEHSQPNEGEQVPYLKHKDPAERTFQDVIDTMTDEQREVLTELIAQAIEATSAEHSESDDSDESDDETPDDEGESEVDHSNENNNDLQHQEGLQMTVHNIFEGDLKEKQGQTRELTHADVEDIFAEGRRLGSLKEAVEKFTLTHGIDNIDVLFPDAQSVTDTPDFKKRRTEWVADVISETRHTPFSRIKSVWADITLEEARARGYVKGRLKREEFFKVAKRVTTPQTIYKKQKLDRDDIIDITEFDVVVWLKAEMRVMLDEEIARAILFGDGRSNADDDKIKEDNVRPIATDDELFVTTVYVNIDDANSSPEELVDAAIQHRHHYRGSGNPTWYTSESMLSKMLLAKDTIGRRIYATEAELAAVLRVRKIVPVEIMENQGDLLAIMVNLADYTVGSDRGGAVSLFDDFDIDYNQFKYLIETRISGALTKMKSAIVFRKVGASAVLITPTAPTFNTTTFTVTVPTVTGISYKNKLTNTTLTTGSPVTLSAGDSLNVIAIPASGYFFSTNADDEWYYSRPAS